MKVHADVFPAAIAIAPPGLEIDFDNFGPRGGGPEGTRRLDRCRIVVVNDRIMIGLDSPEGPKLVFQEKYVSHKKEGKHHIVQTIEGKTLIFRKDDNCGCGSRLRSWQPYGSIVE
jgi:hypothetical protein